MTCREKLRLEHPDMCTPIYIGGCRDCPHDYGYLPKPDYCPDIGTADAGRCALCWDREIPEDGKASKEIKAPKPSCYDNLGHDLNEAVRGLTNNGFSRTEALGLINSIIIGNGVNCNPSVKGDREHIASIMRKTGKNGIKNKPMKFYDTKCETEGEYE